MNVDLGGGKTDALGGIHGLQHVIDQVTQLGVHGTHREGLGAQARSGYSRIVRRVMGAGFRCACI